MSALLELSEISVSFPAGGVLSRRRIHALRDVSLKIDRGEALALVGESGSGKSTVAKVITRLVEPDAGRLILEGNDVLQGERRRASRSYRQRIQMVFQDPFGSLNPVHTVRYHLERPLLTHARASAENVRQKADGLLELCGLRPASDYAEKHPHALSGGQRQRVAIARALAPEPELVVADEPTSMLDVSIRMDVLNLLDELRTSRKLALLLITHDLASARYLADRIAVVYAGRIVEQGDAQSVVGSPRHPYTELLLSAVPSADRAFSAPLAAKPAEPNSETPRDGCAFFNRCPKALPQCSTQAPPWVAVPTDSATPHLSRCHLAVPFDRGDVA